MELLIVIFEILGGHYWYRVLMSIYAVEAARCIYILCSTTALPFTHVRPTLPYPFNFLHMFLVNCEHCLCVALLQAAVNAL
jgi:hypothetical protein